MEKEKRVYSASVNADDALHAQLKKYQSQLLTALTHGNFDGYFQLIEVLTKASDEKRYLFALQFEDSGRNTRATHWAAHYNNVNALVKLKETGASLELWDDDSNKPIHYAAKRESIEALICLSQLGCNIHAKGFRGMTAFHYAAYCNKIKSLACL